MLPSVLEIFVVWHPKDKAGARISGALVEHFHGGMFDSLIAGAVEVYPRSAAWSEESGPPRPIPLPAGEPVDGIIPARYVAVLPVLSMELARAVEERDDWYAYLTGLLVEHERRKVLPILVNPQARRSRLGDLMGPRMQESLTEDGGWRRNVVQALTQFVAGSPVQLKVFVSHTRATLEEDERVHDLTEMVRHTISGTRLAHFFDANDLQLGSPWASELLRNASQGAFLALRTSRYASRAWCQDEMRTAKEHGVPIVVLDARQAAEDRGSFLLDHVPRVLVRYQGDGWSQQDVDLGLSLLVDQALQKLLWRRQAELGAEFQLTWWAPQAPEPLTLATWLEKVWASVIVEGPVRVIHPDPPLGRPEQEELERMLRLHDPSLVLELLTPRQLVALERTLDG
jgi:hypothetical protein